MNYSRTLQLETTFIISQFLWFGNPGAAKLGPSAQALSKAAVRCQLGLIAMWALYRAASDMVALLQQSEQVRRIKEGESNTEIT